MENKRVECQSTCCAVVVTYNPSPDVLENVRLLGGQVGHVVVVDNTAASKDPAVLHQVEQLEACTVLRNRSNLGIATALNLGIRHAIALGFPWIITFDQDSRVPEGYMEAMFATYRQAAGHCRVGMLCPRYRDPRLDVFLYTSRAASGNVLACMTSGSMFQAATFQQFGPMEDDFFMDYVDHEFCLRLRAAGFQIIQCPNAVLAHSLGRITRHRLLGKSYTTTNHSAKRRYYITRNRLVLIRRYYSIDRAWAMGELKGLFVETIKILLAEQDKLSKARYICLGIYDALRFRMGPRVSL